MIPYYLEIASGPGKGARAVLNRSPFRVGKRVSADFRLDAPGLPDDLFTLFEEEAGWIIAPSGAAIARGVLSRNGLLLTSRAALSSGDVIGLSLGASLRFASGEPNSAVSPAIARTAPPASAFTPHARAGPGIGEQFARAGSSVAEVLPSGRRMLWSAIGIAAVAGVLVVAIIVTRKIRTEAKPLVVQEQPLAEADAILFDNLLLQSYDHLERGAALLDAGARPLALAEFARAVNVMESSRLRSNPWLRPRIEALQSQVAAMYRTRNMAVPGSYAASRSTVALRPTSTVSPGAFKVAIDQIGQGFVSQWSRSLTITGRDHAEHLALYGVSGAVDVRSKDLTAAQVQWLIGRCRQAGLRVKDFSADSVLRDQIARATAAGLADRAGTGLHLHVDRFAGRADRYTVGR